AIEVYRPLTADSPAVPALRSDTAAVYQSLGGVLESLNRPGDAEKAYRRATEPGREPADRLANDPGYRRTLALAHLGLGRLLKATGRAKDRKSTRLNSSH